MGKYHFSFSLSYSVKAGIKKKKQTINYHVLKKFEKCLLRGAKRCSHPKVSGIRIISSPKQSRPKKTQEETLPFPLTAWRKYRSSPPTPIKDYLQRIWARYGGGNSVRGLEFREPLCYIVSAWPNKYLFTKHLLFYLHVNCLHLLWRSKHLPLHVLFNVSDILAIYSVLLGLSHVCKFWFFPLYLPPVNLILR